MRWLTVDTKNWWPGKMVLISPQWFTGISWSKRQVFLEVDRIKVKNSSSEYDPTETANCACLIQANIGGMLKGVRHRRRASTSLIKRDRLLAELYPSLCYWEVPA